MRILLPLGLTSTPEDPLTEVASRSRPPEYKKFSVEEEVPPTYEEARRLKEEQTDSPA
jgi:hypothetical protein